jgi:glycosyltransferase involved in cell wall biosynthesis
MIPGYGIDEVAYMISSKLLTAGYDVTVLTTWLDHSINLREIKVRELPLLHPFFLNEYWHRHFLIDFRSTRLFTEMLEDYDLIITCDPMHIIGASFKIRFNKPVLMYHFGIVPHNVLDSIGKKMESFRQKMTWYPSFSMADYIMTNSKYTKSLLPSKLQKRTVVNYHGIEHLENKQGNIEEFKRQMGLENKHVILSIGRFSSSYKGMKDLAEIFAKFIKKNGNTVLVLVGGGTHEIRCSADLRVLRNLSYEELRLCFASCDVYCSASKWEGFDLPLLAAQANGKPVVAFNVGAHAEVVQDKKTGFLARDYADFVNFLNLLLKDGVLRERMGKNAVEYAKGFTWKKSIRIVEDLIEAASINYRR